MPVVMPDFESDDGDDDMPKCLTCGATKVVRHLPKPNGYGLTEVVVCPNLHDGKHNKLAH